MIGFKTTVCSFVLTYYFFQDSKVENETDVPSVGKYPAMLIICQA